MLAINLKSKNKVGIFSRIMKLCIIIVVLSSFSMCAINIWQSQSHINKETATELENTAKRVNYYIGFSDDARRDIIQLAEYEDELETPTYVSDEDLGELVETDDLFDSFSEKGEDIVDDLDHDNFGIRLDGDDADDDYDDYGDDE